MRNSIKYFIILFFIYSLVVCAVDFRLISKSIPNRTGHEYLNKTLIVTKNTDFGMKELELVEACRDQSETQRAVLRVKDGVRIKNLIVGVNAGDGIHCEGNCVLENVHWRDVCEDGATFDKSNDTTKVMTIIGGSAYNASDKLFQHNGAGKLIVKNFFAKNIGKFARSCGTCYKIDVSRKIDLNNIVVDGLKETVVGIQINKNDSAILKNIQVTNGKRNKNGTLHASICSTYIYNASVSSEPIFYSTAQFKNVCSWGSDVTIS